MGVKNTRKQTDRPPGVVMDPVPGYTALVVSANSLYSEAEFEISLGGEPLGTYRLTPTHVQMSHGLNNYLDEMTRLGKRNEEWSAIALAMMEALAAHASERADRAERA